MEKSKIKYKNQNTKIFFKSFLKNPLRTGSIIQSSPLLAEKMLSKINFDEAKCIVEFGAGSGIITNKILKKMRKDCTLLCFEIEPSLAAKLRSINDQRIVIINDSAENIDIYLKRHGFRRADCIVSGLPLASLPLKTTNGVLRSAYAYLRTGGSYIQFQYSLVSLRPIRYLFSSVAVSFVFLNFPPAFVYVCVKG